MSAKAIPWWPSPSRVIYWALPKSPAGLIRSTRAMITKMTVFDASG